MSAARPNRYEVAYGIVEGEDPSATPLPAPASGADPRHPRASGAHPRDPRGSGAHPRDPRASARQALEAAVARALRRPPAVVSFSGGRDSSAVLALAADVARREGLPPPVPVTLRFPASPESDESAWQEQVVRHLELVDWERVEVAGSDLDFVGPVSGAVLRRHGVLWPANTAFHAPLLARAAGGSLLTGLDGDVLFGGWRWEPAGGSPARARSYPVLRVVATLPPAARRPIVQRAMWRPPWVRTQAAGAFAAWQASVWSLEPRRWDARVRWWWRRRYLAALRDGLDLLAVDAGASVHHPFLSPAVVAAVAAEGGTRGFGGRTAAMRHLVGDLLPDAVLTRGTKALFNSAMWGEHTRAFVGAWAGDGIDAELLDADVLRAEWHRPVPHLGSALALQTAWLATRGS